MGRRVAVLGAYGPYRRTSGARNRRADSTCSELPTRLFDARGGTLACVRRGYVVFQISIARC